MIPEHNHDAARAVPSKLNRGLRVPNAPAAASPTYRCYDATENALREVGRVMPAMVTGTGVSTDRVSDGWHLVVEVTTQRGEEFAILVCRRGWWPLGRAASQTQPTPGGPVFSYSTQAPYAARILRLSIGDRQKIVAAVLEQFMGPADWDKLQAWRRGRFQ